MISYWVNYAPTPKGIKIIKGSKLTNKGKGVNVLLFAKNERSYLLILTRLLVNFDHIWLGVGATTLCGVILTTYFKC